MSTSPKIEMVKFDGGILEVLRQGKDGWVCVRALCEGISIQTQAQQKRLVRASWATTSMMDVVAADGRQRKVFCLRSDCLPMFLARIDAARVQNPEARKAIAIYQKNATAALDRWVRGEAPAQRQVALELVDDVRMPQPVLNELLAELRATSTHPRHQGPAARPERQRPHRAARARIPGLAGCAPAQTWQAGAALGRTPRDDPRPLQAHWHTAVRPA